VLTRHISQDKLRGLYAAADAFVLPSRGEGWGRPHVEAMAMALPGADIPPLDLPSLNASRPARRTCSQGRHRAAVTVRACASATLECRVMAARCPMGGFAPGAWFGARAGIGPDL